MAILAVSLINREYVSVLIAQRLPVTATLAAEALLIALVVGVPLGVYAAVRRGTATDTAVKTLSGLTHAFPEFWVRDHGNQPVRAAACLGPRDGFRADLGGSSSASSVRRVAGIDPRARTMFGHRSLHPIVHGGGARRKLHSHRLGGRAEAMANLLAFRPKNALIPIVTVTGIVAGALVGGAVLVERVFAIPGVGDLLAEGVLQKDFPVVQGATVLMMGVVILINLLVDITCALLDPRTRAHDDRRPSGCE